MQLRTALVTGSSRGIGAAIARQLVTDGWQVILHGSKPSDQLQASSGSLGDRCLGTVVGDLSNPAASSDVWDSALELGPIDALVNNAGIYIPCKFSSPDWAENSRAIFQVNFDSPVQLMHQAVQHFLGRDVPGGKIVNVASRVGFRGEAGASAYAASKAALINMTRSLAVEFGNTGIEFFGIAPGWVDTSMARDGMDDRLPSILETIPMGRMASPEDCAAATSFLLSEGSGYLSGVVIDINGASYFH